MNISVTTSGTITQSHQRNYTTLGKPQPFNPTQCLHGKGPRRAPKVQLSVILTPQDPLRHTEHGDHNHGRYSTFVE